MKKRQSKSAACQNGIEILDLDDYFPYWVASLSRLLVQRLQVRLEEKTGLTVAEWRLMAVVACNRDAQAIDISKLTRLNQVAVHRAVKALVARRLLRRDEYADDKRRKLLRLTPEGWSVYSQVLPAAKDIERDLLDFMTPPERKNLRKLLGQLHKKTKNEAL
jgi:DNA-binding MarR family transcriptional regulator